MQKSLNILLIEDDEIEIMKLQRVKSSLNLNHKILEARNGEEALVLLEKSDRRPDIIFLDLNMPKIDGIQFLTILKADKILRSIPVIILTTSSNHNDVLKCLDIGVAGYIIKPLKYDDYIMRIEKVFEYWSINELVFS